MLLRYLIGAALRRLRHDRGLTLEALARLSSVSVPYLSEIERGRKEVSSEVLASVCEALGVTLEDLLDEVRVLLDEAAVLPSRRHVTALTRADADHRRGCVATSRRPPDSRCVVARHPVRRARRAAMCRTRRATICRTRPAVSC